ncbi:FAD:protein FMN transferase [Microbacterium sp. X-17]|uniref:FAD:protein FMN transferase n=1 Tax=Microbacterium sp. X-17 TaxID=3144404 RepID=UPI0031F54588
MSPVVGPRRVWVEHLMGTAVSIHVIGERCGEEPVAAAAEGCFAELRDVERVFSTYRDDSDISRVRRGELALPDADPRVSVVAARCRVARIATGGRFSAWWRGWFDPTGFVKGWSVEEAARRHLEPLLAAPGVVAAGINAGGDLRVFTAGDADWTWRIGIADPRTPGGVIATLELRDGAVATSGTAERGEHIVDPRTGRRGSGVRSATVVADDLATADVWATTAVVAGGEDLGWISRAPVTTGMIVDDDGRVRRWIAGVEVEVVPATS